MTSFGAVLQSNSIQTSTDTWSVFVCYLLTHLFRGALTYDPLVTVFWILAMNIFGSLMVLLLILIEAAPPTTSSVPILGECSLVIVIAWWAKCLTYLCPYTESSLIKFCTVSKGPKCHRCRSVASDWSLIRSTEFCLERHSCLFEPQLYPVCSYSICFLTTGVYYCFNIALAVAAILLSTVVVNVSEGVITLPQSFTQVQL